MNDSSEEFEDFESSGSEFVPSTDTECDSEIPFIKNIILKENQPFCEISGNIYNEPEELEIGDIPLTNSYSKENRSPIAVYTKTASARERPTICPICFQDVITHFPRHLLRHHKDNEQVHFHDISIERIGKIKPYAVPVLHLPNYCEEVSEENCLLVRQKICLRIYLSKRKSMKNEMSSILQLIHTKQIELRAQNCGAKNPSLLTSSKFRKHIATTLQLMTLEQNEMEQIATFMGHTKKTHEEFYRLPQDIYQTAKVAKILLLLEKGRGNEFKGKKLSEIELNNDVYYSSESENEDEHPNLISQERREGEKENNEEEIIVGKHKGKSLEAIDINPHEEYAETDESDDAGQEERGVSRIEPTVLGSSFTAESSTADASVAVDTNGCGGISSIP
ncbi:hypothetical protein QE152_g12493 [Popillia japonica]|uniref:C2H2-type domain-containing protein n=1 Tax=Popillia japonica TaxID=7064 RepID=A0AAW1LRJ7_POPJA